MSPQNKRYITLIVFSLFLFAGGVLLIAQRQQFALKEGDTVAFYGDSITAQRLYTKFTEEFVLTRYPTLNLHFVNAGVSGDTVYGGKAGSVQARIPRDIAPFHPTMITVMLGMNDGSYVGEPKSSVIEDKYKKGYQELLGLLENTVPGASFTLIRPSPYDEITHGSRFPGYSRVLENYGDDVVEIAKRLMKSGNKSVLVADLNEPVVKALKRAQIQLPQLASTLLPDHVHPTDTVHWIMAAALVSAWHIDPIVSRLELDASHVEITSKSRTTVTNLKKTTGGLQWTQLEEALPLPIDPLSPATSILYGISGIDEIDQQTLEVDGLDPGSYQLLIDTKPIDAFSQKALQQGVNLAHYKTPMLEQAMAIDKEEGRRNTLDQSRFMLMAEFKHTTNTASGVTALLEAEEQINLIIHAEIQPKPHDFELRRQ
jgi:lysophospholipase L1-like esterase